MRTELKTLREEEAQGKSAMSDLFSFLWQADSCHLCFSHTTLCSLLWRWGLDKAVKSRMDWERLDSLRYAAFQALYKGVLQSLYRTHPLLPWERQQEVLSFQDPSLCGDPSSAFSLHSLVQQVLNAPIPSIGCLKRLFLLRAGTSNDAHTISCSEMVLSSMSTKCSLWGSLDCSIGCDRSNSHQGLNDRLRAEWKWATCLAQEVITTIFLTDDLTVGRLYEEAFVVSNFLLQDSKTWWIQMGTEEVA